MFPFFPYTNFHELNADWILKTVKNLADAASQLADNLAHVVRVTAQTFTQSEKAQARQNIGAISANDLPNVSDVVRYSPQDLTPTQQTRTRLNIGATSQADIELLLATKHYVKYDEQTLTDAQQVQARANIGAAYSGDVTDLADRVADVENVTAIALTSAAQTLTDAQKAQARTNIGAGSATDAQDNANEIQIINEELDNLYPFVVTFSGTTENGNAACDKTWSAISAAITAGRPLIVRYINPGAGHNAVDSIYILSALIGNGLLGKFLDIANPSDPGDSYTRISCNLTPNNTVSCMFEDV